ncbi:UNVERIFIED_CONTAM: hypothetical protein Slati_1716600 [Sesamum latifolium]|uniref:Uncharacterized protein n=1 Tax=Sesamum latifolium TaxID=2727402 RepID=A0AAW2WVI4_9LAMI
MTKLEHIEKEIVDLKEQRTSSCATLRGKNQLSHHAQSKVDEIDDDIAALENTIPLKDAIVENLEEHIKSLSPFS